MDELSIHIENLYNHFKTHLNNNSRVLFSGMYGIGKTYFLKEFFQNEKFKDEYNIFHLFPVNYQVSNNEDIFELIKIDILYHILGKEWKFEEEEQKKISKTLALQAYTINKASSTFKAITQILTMGKSKSVVDGADELEKIITGFTKYYKELNSSESTLDAIREFGQIFENKKGSIYEFDNITQLICELLKRHSSADTEEAETGQSSEIKKKESVLIIDDLDRIDPEHIFRILNVFSAHFDIRNEDSNKFGFDKVIFVCDVENIRNIFSSKYGVNTDFNGYMNKFFSSHIYHFDNRKEINKTVMDYINSKYRRLMQGEYNDVVRQDLRFFIGYLIESNAISIRHIKNLEKFDFTKESRNKKTDKLGSLVYPNLIKIIYTLFNGDVTAITRAFQNIELPLGHRFNINETLSHLVLILDIEQWDKDNMNEQKEFVYNNDKLGVMIKYSVKSERRLQYAVIKSINDNDMEAINASPYLSNITLNTLGMLMIESFKFLERKKVLEIFD